MQTVHRFWNSLSLRWVALNPEKMIVLHHDCLTMLQTRFVLLTENSMIRRCSITRILWMMNTVFSWFHSGSSGNLCELTDFTIRILRKMAIHGACQLACFCSVSWTFSAKTRRWVDSSSELTLISSSVFLFRLDCKLSHHDTEVAPERPAFIER